MTRDPTLTDRRIRTATDLDGLAFDEAGLLPVVAQDAERGHVLMVAWASREALERTIATGEMHYWSRSRKALWRKGETSGNTQSLVSLHADCDGDTVLARVAQAGPACHTGEPTCFGAGASRPGAAPPGSESQDAILQELWTVLEDRDRKRPEGSYTTQLLSSENRRIKKLGEETAELVSALVQGSASIPEEAADLVYHLLVALKGAGRSWAEVEEELRKRRE